MRIIFLSLVFLCSCVFCFSQSKIDVLHYSFEIKLRDIDDTIKGIATITWVSKETTTAFVFDLATVNNKNKGMKVTNVHAPTLSSRSSLSPMFIQKDDKLIVNWYKESKKGDTVKAEIFYEGVPADGLIISKTKYGHRSFFADNWPDRGHNWIPCHEDPADKATVDFVVTAPEHYQVVANGVQIEETSLGNNFRLTHWKEDTPISTKVMVIGVADFAVNLAGVVNGNIPIYSWVYPENKDKGFYDYEMAKDILPFFINNVGPYGYKKLANVQSKTRFGGLENANTIFYSEGSVTGTRKSEGLLAHEIAHQWFGNMATEKSFGHLWLSEGFATYFTILYFENKYGKDTAIKMLKEDKEQIIKYSKESNKAVVDTDETNYMKLLNANSYQKGGWVLHMLRSELGDDIFWKSIKKYYAKYAGGVADTRDLQKVFEEVSGKNLKQFFDQWLYMPGQPDILINWEYDEVAGRFEAIINQQQKDMFRFPLKFKIQLASGKSIYKTIDASKKSVSFEIYLKEKVIRLIPDPDVELLANYSIKGK